MKDEIKEILDNLKEAKEKEAFFYTLTSNEVHYLLDYITNLQNIISDKEDTMQNKNECITAYDEIIKNRDKEITNLQEKNEKLKELCDKYEEEHNTAFKLWKGKLKETMDETLIQKQHDRIKELEQINEEHRRINGKLREENERLTRSVVSYDETLLKRNNEYEDYKTRNEKAVELINKYSNYPTYYLTGNIVKELLEILQGKSDE